MYAEYMLWYARDFQCQYLFATPEGSGGISCRRKRVVSDLCHRKVPTMKQKKLYKVVFTNEGKLFELYANEVVQGGWYGFIEVSGILFGERSSVVVDPSEEKLKAEFGDVRRTWIPLHAVVRVDEVEKQGSAKIRAIEGKGAGIAAFPGQGWTPGHAPPDRKPE
jgi:hypothetical protein